MSEQLHPIGGENQHGAAVPPPMGDDDANNPTAVAPIGNGVDNSHNLAVVPVENWVRWTERLVKLEERAEYLGTQIGQLAAQVENLPTRDEMDAKMLAQKVELLEKMQAHKDELHADMKLLRDEIHADMKLLRDEMNVKFQVQDANIKSLRDEVFARLDKLEAGYVRLEEAIKHLASKEQVVESEARIMVAIAESKAAASRNNLYLIIAVIGLAVTIVFT